MTKEEMLLALYSHFNKDIVDTVWNANRYKRIIERHIPKDGHYEDYVNVQLCAKLYQQYHIPIYKLAMIYGTSDVALRERLINMGVPMRGHKCGPDTDNNYFSNIDSKNKAYFLGLITADGCLQTTSNGGYNITIGLNQEDGYILEAMRKDMNIHSRVKVYKRNVEGRIRLTSTVQIHSEQMYNDLQRLGLTQHKSYNHDLSVPQLTQNLVSHYIRGYFDGNGIAFSNGKIGFCGARSIVQFIHDYFTNYEEVSDVSVTYNSRNHIYYLVWYRSASVCKIIEVMYNEADNLFLNRKRNKIINGLKARGIEIC